MQTVDDLSPREEQILKFVRTFTARRGYAPTMREIGAEIGIDSASLVSYYLDNLQKHGVIKRDKRVARSIIVVRAA